MHCSARTGIIALFAFGLMASPLFGQGAQGAKITQRARDLANENNARQGASQPSQPASPAAQPQKATAPSPAQVQQSNVNRIKASIAAILAGTEAPKDKIDKFAADLSAAARGAKKPSVESINKLANGIAKNLAGKKLGSAEQLRLAQDLEAIANSSSFSKLQADAYVSDVQSILEAAGVKGDALSSAAADIKTVVSELKH
jgi:hypothetical protein